MIISRTPYRVSLFGGGTDYPRWYRQHGGAVVGTTINKYCYISVRALPPFFEHRHRIVYSKIETANHATEIQHPAVRAVLQELGDGMGLEIHHDGDLPARSGLGSSSSFTVGMLNAMYALYGRMTSARELANEAIRIEQEVIGENVGSQDQIWAAHGGTNLIEFHPGAGYTVTPIILSAGRRVELNDHMMLFFTGFSRYASDIAKAKIANLDRRESQLRTMRQMVDQALDILRDERRPIAEIGRLLHESWRLKRELADNVTTVSIDAIYQAGIDAGAIGGKLLGAGGGGFMLFFVAPDRRAAVREQLKKFIEVRMEIGSPGSRIVVYEPEEFEQHRPPVHVLAEQAARRLREFSAEPQAIAL